MHKSVSELLDIFLITFNRAKALDRTLEQLLDDKSPIKDFEINIIDNNSSDNTSLIVQKWQKNHPNLKYASTFGYSVMTIITIGTVGMRLKMRYITIKTQ